MSPAPNLPRHHCRGLIEALNGFNSGAGGDGIFRGITAAASLKRAGRRLGVGGESEIIFRGITAAASLKLGASPNSGRSKTKSSAASLPRPH